MSRHVVAAVRELPAGARKTLTVKGRPIVVFNLNGSFFGLLDRCPHQGACLSGGILGGVAQADEPGKIKYTRQGEFLRCPWHGWEFNIRTAGRGAIPSGSGPGRILWRSRRAGNSWKGHTSPRRSR